jgi:hypothetical protein
MKKWTADRIRGMLAASLSYSASLWAYTVKLDFPKSVRKEEGTLWLICYGNNSRPFHFNAGERVPGFHWVRGWAGPRVGLNVMEKSLFASSRNRTLNPQPSSP